MKNLSSSITLCSFSGLLLSLLINTYALAFEIDIDVAPNVLNIQSDGYVVTVHTDIVYGDVYAYSVYLNEVPINSWKADNRGFFVAKFLMDSIKAVDGLVFGAENTFTLIGMTQDEEPASFFGIDQVWVVDNVPAKGER